MRQPVAADRFRFDSLLENAAEASDVKTYPITPVPKPRQTQRDSWRLRPPVARYRAFRDEVRLHGVSLPESGYHVVFVLPMPASWPEAKKRAMDGQPHQRRPDKDNLEKALLDAVYGDDCSVWDGRTTKIWGREGAIIIRTGV